MDKKTKRKKRKTEKLIFGIGLTSVIFIVATYAWFVGLTQVSVSDFEIEVKSSDGLTLSLTGDNFANSVNVSEELVTTELADSYSTNTNHWVGEEGLVPLSSAGIMNKDASRLTLFSKTSIVSLSGGYKLRADLIDNTSSSTETLSGFVDEQDGYVAFDLFIKNSSGNGYTEEYSAGDDEGIYLTTDSIVKMVASGVDAPEDEGGDGIENSVRVAFMQIGRVAQNSAASVAQSIKCYAGEGTQTTYTYGTSLCNAGENNGKGITWNIWEPNDTRHNTSSEEHFSKICKKRTGVDTYSGTCTPIADGTANTTYAVNSKITASDNVNIYDGLNDYESVSSKLTAMTYFTDTNKNDADGLEIFYLAPNSITKIRVYVYLEGQDVDNYDLGSIGKKVSITFGFTKNKYITEES